MVDEKVVVRNVLVRKCEGGVVNLEIETLNLGDCMCCKREITHSMLFCVSDCFGSDCFDVRVVLSFDAGSLLARVTSMLGYQTQGLGPIGRFLIITDLHYDPGDRHV